MNAAAIAARFTEALETAATEAAGAPTALVSLTLEILTPGDGVVTASVTRKTRTLIFLSAELRNGDTRIAMANSVHKLR